MKKEMVLDRETAENDFQKWADCKKLRPSVIEKNEDAKDTMIELLQIGVLAMNEDCSITQNLEFTLEAVDSLKFRPRLNVKDLRKMKSVKSGDDVGHSAAIMAELAGVHIGVIDALETNDYLAAQAVASFYMVGR
jgi:hypothetical protein